MTIIQRFNNYFVAFTAAVHYSVPVSFSVAIYDTLEYIAFINLFITVIYCTLVSVLNVPSRNYIT